MEQEDRWQDASFMSALLWEAVVGEGQGEGEAAVKCPTAAPAVRVESPPCLSEQLHLLVMTASPQPEAKGFYLLHELFR